MQDGAMLRGYSYPLLFHFGYKVLQVLGLDDTWLFLVMPRTIQAVFAALGDCFTFMLAFRLFGGGGECV